MIDETIEVLKWIGIDWDGELTIQSTNLSASYSMFDYLLQKDLIYHCQLSRKELDNALSAPHQNNEESTPSYRPKDIPNHNATRPKNPTNWRFVADKEPQVIYDEFQGKKTFSEVNDFVVWTKLNLPAYQLAVVADDHRQLITDVVRGNDLMQSASWQQQLYRAMEWATPSWHHLPLIVGEDNKRLAKRHGDSRISTYRTRNVSAERIIGLIAMWTNTQQTRKPMHIKDFLHSFEVQHIDTDSYTFTLEDDAWLLE